MSVDWDLLADHLGGALAGTPEEQRVAELIATDPHWARAATELAAALDSVTADLHAMPAPAMPEEITARLDAVLREPATVAAGVATAVPTPRPGGTPAGGQRDTVRATGERQRRPPTRRDSRRRRPRRLVRWGAGLAAAAGVVAFAAVGSATLLPTQSAEQADSGAMAPDTLDAEQPRELDSEPVLLATGTDYHPDTRVLAPPEGEDGGPSIQGDIGEDPDTADGGPEAAPGPVPNPSVPPELDRLWSDPQARAECLALVADSIAPAPVTIESIDFARFEGEPALVVWLTDADSARWVWVSGPGCGTPAAGLDERYHTRLS